MAQVLTLLFSQLHQERERLDAMMTHLRMDGKGVQNGVETAESVLNSDPPKASSVTNVKPSNSFSQVSFSGYRAGEVSYDVFCMIRKALYNNFSMPMIEITMPVVLTRKQVRTKALRMICIRLP